MTSDPIDGQRRATVAALLGTLLGGAGCGGGGADAVPSPAPTPAPSTLPPPPPAPLTLQASLPADGGIDIERTVRPALTFSAALDPGTVTAATVQLTAVATDAVPATLAANGLTLSVEPTGRLWPDTEHRIDVQGVAGIGGEALAAPIAMRFVTRDGQWRDEPVVAAQPGGASDGESHQLAMAPDASAVVVWIRPDGANRDRLWASRRGADGRWGPPAEVGVSVPGSFAPPSLAMAPDGTAHVAWSSTMGIGGRQQAFVSQLGPTDASWSEPVPLGEDAVLLHMQPVLGAGAGGDLYAVWVSGNSAPYDIRLARRLPDGRWSTPVVANDANGRPVHSPTLAVTGDGRAVLVWVEQVGNEHALVWRAFRRDVSAPEALAPPAEVGGRAPLLGRFSLALNAAGDGVLAWQVVDGTTTTLYASIKGVVVADWSTPLTLDDASTDDHSPRVAVDETGNALVVWDGSTQDGTRRVFARRHERASGPLRSNAGWSELRTLSEADDGGMPAMAVDARGNALVLWCSGSRELRASRFTRRQGWHPAAVVATTGAAGSVLEPRVAFDGTGSAAAVWIELELVSRSILSGDLIGLGGARFD